MKRRILFVDDEPLVLEGLEDLLGRYRREWDMAFAAGGRAALQQMERTPFDVIVTDMRMPEMDGAALLRTVKAEHPETVRIVLSGYSEMQVAMRAVPVAHQFLNKPCDADVLEKVIERACGLHAILSDESVRRMVGGVKRLPRLPALYASLARTLADEQAGAGDVTRIIEEDVAVSAKVLQLANSAFFGIGRPISAVEQAVNYLGVRTIQQLVLAAELFDGTGLPRRSGTSIEALRDHALLTAGIARRIVAGYRREADDASTAGLLHDVGKLVMAAELPEQLAAASNAARESGRPLYQAERELNGITHAEVGAYLLGAWGLPYPIIEAVANHHAPGRVHQPGFDALTAVHVANALAHECVSAGAGVRAATLDHGYIAALGLADQVPAWREFARELASAPAATAS
jgi:putative nucleotidyltransferase with HDIG domain